MKKTKEEVADIIQCEGLGYAIQHYMNYDQIADSHLAEQWKKAGEALDTITSMLEDYLDY